MIRAFVSSFVVAAVLFSARPAESHHSNVLYEVTKVVTITGTVKEFRWVNPHTWLYMTVDDGRGGKTEWKVEGRAPGILRRAGWKTTSLVSGETVTVDMSPAKDGSHTGMVARVTKSNGTILGNTPLD